MANKTNKILTENILRATLDKIKVSLLSHYTENVNMRSAQSIQEITLPKNLGLKTRLLLTWQDRLKL